MGRKTKIDALKPEHKKQLEHRLIHQGFHSYQELADWLNECGYQISKAGVHRYGQKLEKKLNAVKESTQAALMIAEAVPDEQDLRSQAVLSILQTEIFNALVEMQFSKTAEEDSPVSRILLFSKIGRGLAEVIKASRENKKWQVEVNARLQAEFDAMEKDKENDALTLAKARTRILEIYGIGDE